MKDIYKRFAYCILVMTLCTLFAAPHADARKRFRNSWRHRKCSLNICAIGSKSCLSRSRARKCKPCCCRCFFDSPCDCIQYGAVPLGGYFLHTVHKHDDCSECEVYTRDYIIYPGIQSPQDCYEEECTYGFSGNRFMTSLAHLDPPHRIDFRIRPYLIEEYEDEDGNTHDVVDFEVIGHKYAQITLPSDASRTFPAKLFFILVRPKNAPTESEAHMVVLGVEIRRLPPTESNPISVEECVDIAPREMSNHCYCFDIGTLRGAVYSSQ